MEKSIYTERHQCLIKMLRDERVNAGITQTELADRLSVPQSFVAKYELGERRLDAVELIQVLEALGVSANSFIENWLFDIKVK